jgi:rhodanese-related sulfurtransferase
MKKKRTLFFLLAVLGIVVVAFGLNALRRDSLPLARQDAAARDAELEALEKQGGLPLSDKGDFPLVSFEELAAIVKSLPANVLILDARVDFFYNEGHIPGARNFPSPDFATEYPKFREAVAGAKRVIVYCQDRQCGSSHDLAAALRAKGHGTVEIFRGGWVEWERKGRIQN